MSKELLTLKPFKIGKFATDGRVIGVGSFATVCLGVNTETQEKVAIKIVKKDFEEMSAKTKKQLEAEIDIMKSLSHPNIVKLYDVCRHPANQELCLVMEYCDMGDLESYLRTQPHSRIGEQEAKEFFLQLVEGLRYLRSKNIIHRDLKPENILLSSAAPSARPSPSLKICDFGLARVTATELTLAQTQCGSPLYMSPEIWLGTPYTYKADLWSLGVVLYRMIAGRPLLLQTAPLSPTTLLSTDPAHRIYQGLTASLTRTVSPALLDLLDRLLQQNPDVRIDWNTFLAHPFLTSTTNTSPSLASALPNSVEPPFPHLYSPPGPLTCPSDETSHELRNSVFEVFGDATVLFADAISQPVDTERKPSANEPRADAHEQSLTEADFQFVNDTKKTQREEIPAVTHTLTQTPGHSPTRQFMCVSACVRVAEQLESHTPAEALALYVACLRALRALYSETKPVPDAEKVRTKYLATLKRAERCVTVLNTQALLPVDSALDILWRCVLALGRSGAVDETQRRYESSAEKYTLGQLCIEFIIGKLPPAATHHLSTLYRFLDKFTLRLAAVKHHIKNFNSLSFSPDA
jgi:serine/threonine-protein kinase ULK/ATG1